MAETRTEAAWAWRPPPGPDVLSDAHQRWRLPSGFVAVFLPLPAGPAARWATRRAPRAAPAAPSKY